LYGASQVKIMYAPDNVVTGGLGLFGGCAAKISNSID
jgi:hypothetical protein